MGRPGETGEGSPRPRNGLCLALIFLGGFAHSAVYAITNPVFEAPDEPGHLAYVNFVAGRLSLPNQYDPKHSVPQGHHWPLYYLVAGGLVRLAGGPIEVTPRPVGGGSGPQFHHSGPSPFRMPRDRVVFYGLRLLGSLMAGITVLQVARAARIALPEGRGWVVAPLLTAAWPQLAFMGGSISNDPAVALLGSCATVAGLQTLAQPERRRRWLSAGIWAGLAALAKKSALVYLPALAMGLAVILLARRTDRRWAVAGCTLAALGVALAVGPVLIRNQLLYLEPLGTRMEQQTLWELVFPQPLRSFHFWAVVPTEVPESLLARFGWMNVRVDPRFVWPTFRLVELLAALSVLGLGAKRTAPAVSFLGTAVFANVAALVYYNILYPQPQGRLLLPVLAPLAVLCALGASLGARRVPFALKATGLAALAGWLALLAWLAFWTNVEFYR